MATWKTRLTHFGILGISSGGFSGYLPGAPGTWGSLVGLAIVWGIRHWALGFQIALSAAVFAVGVWASDRAGRLHKEADSSHIVVDEIVGMMVTMIGIPVTQYWLVWGFLIFRLLDVVKLPPADFCDARLKNGWGVMLDDLFAAIYGNIWLHLMLRATL